MDKSIRRFFWEGVDDQRKLHMVNWATVCKPKDRGDLGIINTKILNVAFLLKWVWKLCQNKQALGGDRSC
jgi:hypothetical protein